jgi:hypothetical protein
MFMGQPGRFRFAFCCVSRAARRTSTALNNLAPRTLTPHTLALCNSVLYALALTTACGVRSVDPNGADPASLADDDLGTAEPIANDDALDPSGAPSVHGGQTGAEIGLEMKCGETEPQAIAPSKRNAQGFSANDVIATIEGPHIGSWIWANDDRTDATLRVKLGTGEIQQREYFLQTDAGRVPAPACKPDLAIPAKLELVTEDGKLDERWDVLLIATAKDEAFTLSGGPIHTFYGSYRPTGIELAKDEFIESFVVDFGFSQGRATGSLHAYVEREANPDDPNDVVEAPYQVPIGTFTRDGYE